MAEEEHDLWAGRAVRFVFGAVFGALVGLGAYAYADESARGAWVWIVGAVLICGILAAVLKDDFWRSIAEWWPW